MRLLASVVAVGRKTYSSSPVIMKLREARSREVRIRVISCVLEDHSHQLDVRVHVCTGLLTLSPESVSMPTFTIPWGRVTPVEYNVRQSSKHRHPAKSTHQGKHDQSSSCQ